MLIRPRYDFAQSKVIELFRKMPTELLSFPLDVKAIIKQIPNCMVLSYQDFSAKYNFPLDDIAEMCESQTGCAHYEKSTGKVLIMYNASFARYNVPGRQRWTLAHELGHVILEHPQMLLQRMISEGAINGNANTVIESEADYFASQALSPFPLYSYFNITSSVDVEQIFGLSSQASINRYEQYLKYKARHFKRAYDHQIVQIFKPYLERNHLI